MIVLGDYEFGDDIYFAFTTRNVNQNPVTFSGSPALAIYKNNSTTEDTDGITLSVDYDSVTGLNHVEIDVSADATFYSVGGDFMVVVTNGTVDGVDVTGEVVAYFSIEKRSPTSDVDTLVVRVGIPASTIAGEIATIPDDLLDFTDGVESSRTVREALRLMLSALAGKVSGAETTTVVFRDSNDTKDRITATVDANGNRSAITLDDT